MRLLASRDGKLEQAMKDTVEATTKVQPLLCFVSRLFEVSAFVMSTYTLLDLRVTSSRNPAESIYFSQAELRRRKRKKRLAS